MNTPKQADSYAELPLLLGGKPIGTIYHIEGYVDSSGCVKDLTVKTIGVEAYAKMKLESLAILTKKDAPVIPGMPAPLVAQARDALIAAYSVTGGFTGEFKDPYTESPAGGYSVKPGEPAIYLLRMENLSPQGPAVADTRVDLVRAKAALVRALNLPAGRYMHALKLSAGKFKSVKLV